MSEEIPENAEIPVITEEVVETMGPSADVVTQPIPTEIVEPEVIADPGFWLSLWHGYLVILDYALPALMIIGGIIVLRFLIWESLRFNYHHYLQYGEFVILWGDDGGNHEKAERRKKIAKDLKIMDDDFTSWMAALVMSLVVFAIHVVTALLWPVTMILVVPLAIVRLIGFRKRKKIAFTQKLKGEHLKE